MDPETSLQSPVAESPRGSPEAHRHQSYHDHQAEHAANRLPNRPAVTIVGIGDDGCSGLTSRAFNAISRAQILVGGERALDFFGDFKGQKIVIGGSDSPSGQGGRRSLPQVLNDVEVLSGENHIVVLASGDPMYFGIGNLLCQRLGHAHVQVIPQPSSVQWAFAKIGVKWDDATIISYHGRPVIGFLNRLRSLSKVAILTDQESSPRRLASLMLEAGEINWTAWVAENLTGPGERVRAFSIAELSQTDEISSLNILILLREDRQWQTPTLIPFLTEDKFAKRLPKIGLITKREIRILTLANLGLKAGDVLWDIGAGSGSVGIEAAMMIPTARVYAVECDPEGVAMCEENIRAWRTDSVQVIQGHAPEALSDLEPPNAVFIGGSKGQMGPIVTASWDKLRPGGRLVINAITLENVTEAHQCFKDLQIAPELCVVNISRGVPLAGRYLRYEALNPVHIFAATKPPASLT